MKYQEISIREILELGRRNPIVNHILTLFHIKDDEPNIFVWHQALMHMVKELVQHNDYLVGQNYELCEKGVQINVNLKDLPEKESAQILETLKIAGEGG